MVVDSCIVGYLTISPSPTAAVCQVGGTKEVICTTSDHFLTWKLTKSGSTYPITRTLSSTIRNPERVVVNSTVFTFSRMSELGRTDLVMKLVISTVSQSLNGTKIVCTEIGASAMMANTTVYIIRNKHGGSTRATILYVYTITHNITAWYVRHPFHSIIIILNLQRYVVITAENFGEDEVTVSLEWTSTQEIIEDSFESFTSYNISAKPSESVKVVMVDAMRANLIVPYNVLYNVSVTADFCDLFNASTVMNLMYGKYNRCNHNFIIVRRHHFV